MNFTYDSNSAMITSVTDGDGKLLESHTYDAANRGLTSSRAGGVDLVTASYSPGVTQLTDSLGNATTYSYSYIAGRMHMNSISGPGCATCGGRGNNWYSYNMYGNRSMSTDALGNVTCYTSTCTPGTFCRNPFCPWRLLLWRGRRLDGDGSRPDVGFPTRFRRRKR